jgi:hypothetical protein
MRERLANPPLLIAELGLDHVKLLPRFVGLAGIRIYDPVQSFQHCTRASIMANSAIAY